MRSGRQEARQEVEKAVSRPAGESAGDFRLRYPPRSPDAALARRRTAARHILVGLGILWLAVGASVHWWGPWVEEWCDRWAARWWK